jgi:lysophospholipase L1-like esterase
MKMKTSTAILIVLGVLLASCSDLLSPPKNASSPGSVTVVIDSSNIRDERTLVPIVSSAEFTSYDLNIYNDNGDDIFDPDAEDNHVRLIKDANSRGQVITDLVPGNYYVVAAGYTSLRPDVPSAKSNPVTFTVTGSADTSNLNIALLAYQETGYSGYFTWDPAFFHGTGIYSAGMKISSLGGSSPDATINLLENSGNNIGSQTLEPGDYLLTINVKTSESAAAVGVTDVVRIYSNLITRLPYELSDILGDKLLSGSLMLYTNGQNVFTTGEFEALKKMRFTAKTRITQGNEWYSYGSYVYTLQTGDINSVNGVCYIPWYIRIPMDAESVLLDIEFLNLTDEPVNAAIADHRLITNIDKKGQIPAGENPLNTLDIVYNLMKYSVQVTGNYADRWVHLNDSYHPGTQNGGGGNNHTSFNAAIFIGQMVWLDVGVTSTSQKLDKITLTDGTDLIEWFYKNNDESGIRDVTKSQYRFNMPADTTGAISLQANWTAVSVNKPRIICYGDSVTFGVGDGNWYAYNHKMTYPYFLAEKFNSSVVDVTVATIPDMTSTDVFSINKGVNGNTVKAAVEGSPFTFYYDPSDPSKIRSEYHDMYVDVLQYNPDVVVVFLGINDFMTGYQTFDAADADYYRVDYFEHYYNALLRELANGKRQIYVVKFFTSAIMREYMTKWNYPADRQEEITAKYDKLFNSLPLKYPNVELVSNVWSGIWNEKWIDEYGQERPLIDGVHPNEMGYQIMANNIFAVMDREGGFLAGKTGWKKTQ